MLSPQVRERLLEFINTLDDDQAELILQWSSSFANYRPEDDPIVGMFEGTEDASDRIKQVLDSGITAESGWTIKDMPLVGTRNEGCP